MRDALTLLVFFSSYSDETINLPFLLFSSHYTSLHHHYSFLFMFYCKRFFSFLFIIMGMGVFWALLLEYGGSYYSFLVFSFFFSYYRAVVGQELGDGY